MTYTDKREFNAEQLRRLFSSVGWRSADHPERLLKALTGCETVFTAWESGELVGLVNAIDDGELNAYVHYLLVDPEWQGKGVGTALLDMVREKYRDYLYLFLVAEHRELVGYYEKLGFTAMDKTMVMAVSHQ